MKRTYIYLTLGTVALLAVAACNDGGGTSTFNSIMHSSLFGEPSAVRDGDAGPISLTTEPNSV